MGLWCLTSEVWLNSLFVLPKVKILCREYFYTCILHFTEMATPPLEYSVQVLVPHCESFWVKILKKMWKNRICKSVLCSFVPYIDNSTSYHLVTLEKHQANTLMWFQYTRFEVKGLIQRPCKDRSSLCGRFLGFFSLSKKTHGRVAVQISHCKSCRRAQEASFMAFFIYTSSCSCCFLAFLQFGASVL